MSSCCLELTPGSTGAMQRGWNRLGFRFVRVLALGFEHGVTDGL